LQLITKLVIANTEILFICDYLFSVNLNAIKIMKKMFLIVAASLISLASYSQTTWTVDKSHSSIKFVVTHLVISEVEGSFKSYEGKITSTSDDFTNASINFSVDVNSINTESEKRDSHLKGTDFFDAEKFPQITFKSTSFKKVSGNKYELKGDFTMHGVTKPVVFNVVYGGTVKDPWGNTKAGFKASTTINRFDYDLKWNTMTEAGGAVVGADVEISVKLELAKAK
jgi:polyisoprenoid-binding protein YceI